MKKTFCYLVTTFTVLTVTTGSQEYPGLKLVQTIPIHNISARFDHFGIDLKRMRLFLPAEENHSLEIIDLRKGEVIHSIPGFEKAHAVYYRPDVNEIFVSDNNGTCKIFRGDSFDLVKTIRLTLDYADGLRFDPGSKLVYVVNAHKSAEEGAPRFSYLAIIDSRKWEHVGDIKVEGDRIEEVALEPSGSRLFLDVSGRHEIGLVDRDKRTQVGAWQYPAEGVPYAAVLDQDDHRLLVALRRPGALMILDSDSGKMITSMPTKEGIDDIYYDSARRRIYLSAGVVGSTEGYIVIFKQIDPDHYESEGTISTGGASPTSLFVPGLNRYYVAVQSHGAKEAEVQVYEVKP
jgi:DNA-binding beta-propeller fold protein YncE